MSTPDLTFTPAAAVAALRTAIRRRVVGQDLAIDELLAALLARGHVLLEGVPGVRKRCSSASPPAPAVCALVASSSRPI